MILKYFKLFKVENSWNEESIKILRFWAKTHSAINVQHNGTPFFFNEIIYHTFILVIGHIPYKQLRKLQSKFTFNNHNITSV